MNSKIIVKEFDIINEELLRKSNPNYNNEFKELITFIEEFHSSSENADAYDVMIVKKNRLYGEYVQIKKYVGLIQLNSGFQIEILPKIDMATSVEQTKQIFLNMLRSMKDFDGKTFNISNLNIEKMNIYEIFINMYLQEVSWLVKRGLKSAYISCENNLNVLKGKLLIKEQISKNCINKERFFVKYDEYQLNRPENKIIKSTLLKLLKISEDFNNKRLCRQTLIHFENVEPSTNFDDDLSKIVIDRNTKDYSLILKISEAFLKNKSFTSFSGDSKARALLFPMDSLFESYVGKFMKRVFSGSGNMVSTQDKGYYLFDKPNPEFSLRPDIVITKSDGTVVIMDTKWKSLTNVPNKNYGISQADMYQMYAYSKKYGEGKYNPEVWLLYPLNLEMQEYDDYNQKKIEYYDSFGVKVHIFFIDLSKQIIDELNKLKILI